jgi:hypothetical protein
MLNKDVVYEALKQSLTPDSAKSQIPGNQSVMQDSLISLLIHDIFGAEILKTHSNKKWHFYNRLDGERLDFTSMWKQRFNQREKFEDIPATSDETINYVDQTDYSTFFMRFISAFEEAVGLEKRNYGFTT